MDCDNVYNEIVVNNKDPYDIESWGDEEDCYYEKMTNTPGKNIITFPLDHSTCWFNAIILTMFYSRYSRDLIKDALTEIISNLDSHDDLNIIFYELLNLYESKDNKNKQFYDNKFKDINAINILKKLNTDYGSLFQLNVCEREMFESELYIKNLYELFGVSCSMFTQLKNGEICNSIYNNFFYNSKEGSLIPQDFIPHFKQKKDPTDIVVMILEDDNEELYHNNDFRYLRDSVPMDLYRFGSRERVELNGYNYVLDSIIISNYNNNKRENHTICSIRINNDKYLYDGRLKKTSVELDENGMMKNFNIPCNLIRHDWSLNNNTDFMINPFGCGFIDPRNMIDQGTSDIHLFNFSMGKRLLIYVKQDKIKTAVSIAPSKRKTRSVIRKK